MALSTIPVPSLHNGVSQQPDAVRSPDQCEEQVNGWSSLADGLLRRQPSEHIKRLGAPASDALVHQITRDADEKYVVIFSGGQLRVFDLEGNEQTVTAPNGWGYLSGVTDPRTDLSMTSAADYTFIVNRKKTPAMAATPDGAPEPDPQNPTGIPAGHIPVGRMNFRDSGLVQPF